MTFALDVLIVGNGILSYSTAFQLIQKDPSVRVGIVGPRDKSGCASLAAGAMLATFAEAEKGALETPASRRMFEMALDASRRWPAWIQRLNGALGQEKLSINFGTYVLLNAVADEFDDLNFEAVQELLRAYSEPFDYVNPAMIPQYQPEPRHRALSALYIPGEGAVHPPDIFAAFEEIFALSGRVELLDEPALRVGVTDGGGKVVETPSARYEAGRLLLAAGAHCQPFLEQLSLHHRIPRLFFGVGAGVLLQTGKFTPPKVIRSTNRGLACGTHMVPRSADQCYIGATNFISPVPEYNVRTTSLYTLLQGAMEQINHNFYKAQVQQVVVGHRPTSADVFPLLGATSIEGVWLLSGTKRIGLHLSPLLSDWLSDEILGRPSATEPMFRPERPLIHTMTREQGIHKAVAHLKSAGIQHELNLPKAGWGAMVEDMLRRKVESIYDAQGIKDFGIHPELLDMYRYDHIQPTQVSTPS
jgi:glycine oxidase